MEWLKFSEIMGDYVDFFEAAYRFLNVLLKKTLIGSNELKQAVENFKNLLKDQHEKSMKYKGIADAYVSQLLENGSITLSIRR